MNTATRSKRGLLLITLSLLVVTATAMFIWRGPAGLQVAPVVSMKTLPNGTPIALEQLRGRPVLVTFWATSCPGCIKEMPHLVELYNALGPKGLEIIGIAMHHDRPDRVMAMQKSKALPYPVVWDGTRELAAAFGDVRITPRSFLIDPQGQIVRQTLGEMDMSLLQTEILAMLDGARS